MRELTLKEMEKMAADRREFVVPKNGAGLQRQPLRTATGAGIASATGTRRTGYWSLGSVLRAIWLKI